MSCLGPEYNPLPPREWVRFHNRCSQRNEPTISAAESYLLQMNRKANILQYNNNSARFNKNQKYGQLANRYFKTFGSQTQTYSNPNIKLFERTNETYKVLPNVNVINDADVTQIQNINCIKDKIQDIFPNLPAIGGDGGNQPIIPPQPEISPSNPSNPPYIPPPGVTIYVVPDGGKLLCNRIQDPCTGDILDKTREKICFPTSCSDVPGKIELLCWSGREPVYFPKVKRTYGTSGNKWPTNAKFIRTANPPIKINTLFNNSEIQQTVNEEIDFINEEIVNLNQENQLLDNDTLILNKLDSINSLLETSNLQQNNTTLMDHSNYIKFLYNSFFQTEPFIM
jgi:hypothetical protein